MVSGVFITYFGADSLSYASLLYTDLCRRFGAELVFSSTETDPARGEHASESLNRVWSARVVLAVIGPSWSGVTDTVNQGAVDEAGDRFRRELTAAFTSGVRVVAVLTDAAELPAAGDLPGDVAALGR